MGDKSQLTFEERQMTEAQRRQLAIGKAEREDQARREAEKKALDIRAQNPEDFKKELRRKYGNLFRAWKVIDDDESWSARGKSERRTRRLGRRQHTKRTELAIKRTLTPEEL